jgi:hypothetical protein
MIVVVCNDAGSAEIISSWILTQNEEYLLVLDGPAVQIFSRKINNIKTHSLDNALKKADWLVTGSSIFSSLEIDAIAKSKLLNIKSVTFLDHWANYPERFVKNNNQIFPDELWAGDSYAYNIAKKIFPNIKVIFQENAYFKSIQTASKILKSKIRYDKQNEYILYLCSPVAEHAKLIHGNEKYWGYDEHDRIRYFMENLHKLKTSSSRVILRPHPSENPEKYSWAIDEFEPLVSINDSKTLLEQALESEVVVGCNSMGLAIAIIAGKRAVSLLAPDDADCTIPMKELEHLNLLK